MRAAAAVTGGDADAGERPDPEPGSAAASPDQPTQLAPDAKS